MGKVVLSCGFGGFDFSEEFLIDYVGKKFPDAHLGMAEGEFGKDVLVTTTPEVFEGTEISLFGGDGVFDVHVGDPDVIRTDPIAIELLEENGPDSYGELYVAEVPEGVRYFISMDNDSGIEEIVREDEIQWRVG